MTKLLLTIVSILLLASCSPNNNKIVSVEFKDSKNTYQKAIVICMEAPTTTISLSKIILETKDGLILNRSDVLIGDRGGKETCFSKSIYTNLTPKKEASDYKKRMIKNVTAAKIKRIEVYMSDNRGWNYSKKDQFTQYIKQY